MASVPTIDYTNKDFQSLRQAMLDLARYRLPEWTDQSPGDLGILLVDIFAYMGDVILYYQDRVANESFLQTAVERRSVLNALRLIGYELAPPAPAAAELTLVFNSPTNGSSPIVTIRQGAQFETAPNASNGAQTFEYLGPSLDIDLSSDQVARSPDRTKRIYAGLPVTQSQLQSTATIGISTGEPNQMFRIPGSPVILDTLVVEVDEGADWVRWDRRGGLLYEISVDGRVTVSDAQARDYYVQFDENDVCWVAFGDGTYGRVPPVGKGIRASYRIGGGSAGNVAANSITVSKNFPDDIEHLDSVTNPLPAAGGTDREDIAHAKRFGPLAFRSGQRAVTLDDYVALAQQAGGVAKVRAGAPNWNVIKLYVAPEGNTCRPVPEALRRQLISYFENKRMAGTFVEILDATPVPVDLTIELVYDKRYHVGAVRQSVEAAINDLLAFKNVDFGQSLYLSDVYGRVEGIAGVAAMTVTRFRRRDSPTAQVSDQDISKLAASLPAALASSGAAPLSSRPAGASGSPLDVAALIRRALQIDVDTEGRVQINEFEIPVLGTLAIELMRSPQ